MGYELNLYLKKVDDSIISQWVGMLLDMGMRCEIHPDFSFDNQSGFLPFKIESANISIPNHDGIPFISGFELDIYDYTYNLEKQQTDETLPFWKKVFGKRKGTETKDKAAAVAEQKIRNSSKELVFRVSSQDVFEFPLSLYSAAIISSIEDGVIYDPQEDEYLDNINILEKVKSEVSTYYDSLLQNQWNYHKFDRW